MLSAGRERKEIETIIDATTVAGVRNVLALRGDKKVSGEIKDPVSDSAELVRMLRERDAFDEIIVAGYPDIHPDSPNSVADLQQMVRKVAAGATRIITQFCFEVDTLCKYREKLADVGVTQPISVGLLPIRNFEKMLKFAERCKAHVPSDLQERFLSANPKEHPVMAQELLNQMTKELVVKGFDIHYYTLNSVSMVNEAWRAALAGQRQAVN
jgi:methylenetetrahydrofolate reductase (NADPH)